MPHPESDTANTGASTVIAAGRVDRITDATHRRPPAEHPQSGTARPAG